MSGSCGSIIGRIGPLTVVNVTSARLKNGVRWLEIDFEGGKGWVEGNMLVIKR